MRPSQFFNVALLTFLFALVGITTLLAQPPEVLKRASDLFTLGGQQYLSGNYDAAIVSYGEYLKLRPDAASGWYNRGISYQQRAIKSPNRKDLELAAADLSQAIKLKPSIALYWTTRGDVYGRLVPVEFDKYLPLAIADHTQAIKLDPRNAEAFCGRGQMYIERNQLENALADLNSAIRLDSKNGVAYFYRGKVHSFKKNYKASQNDLETAIRLLPNYTTARDLLSWVKEQQIAQQPAKPVVKNVPAAPSLVSSPHDAYEQAETAAKASDHKRVVELTTRGLTLVQLKEAGVTADDMLTSVYLNLLRQRAKAYAALKQFVLSDKDYKDAGMAAIDNTLRRMNAANERLAKEKTSPIVGVIMGGLEATKAVITCKQGIEITNEWRDGIRAMRPNDSGTLLQAAVVLMGNREMCGSALLLDGDLTSPNAMLDKAKRIQYVNEAIAKYNEAMTFIPKDPRPYLARAKAYRRIARNDLAAADEAKAATLTKP